MLIDISLIKMFTYVSRVTIVSMHGWVAGNIAGVGPIYVWLNNKNYMYDKQSPEQCLFTNQ